MPIELNSFLTDEDMPSHPALMSLNREREDGCEARRLRTMDLVWIMLHNVFVALL